MKSLKRLLIIALSLAIMLGMFTACGDKNTDDADSKADSTMDSSVADDASADQDSADDATSEEASDESSEAEADSDDTTSEDSVLTDDTTIRIGGLKGPTTMGLVKLMEDFDNGNAVCNYDFTVEAAADAITPLLVKGELDMIAIPANVASIIYNNTKGAVQVLAINTLGVLYIVEKGLSIESVADLKGKTIYATGKGTTPEYSLRYLLTANGLDPDKDVAIEWKSEATEVVAHLANSDDGIAMLPQPFVTVAKSQIPELEVVLDLNEEWNKTENGSMMVTGVTIVRKAFAEEHPELIAAFLEEYKESAEYIVANPAEASAWVEARIGVKAPIAEKAIPYCNINLISDNDMKAKLEGYLGILFEQNPKSIGGAMPADDFYYEG